MKLLQEVVGEELELEMKRMDAVIQQAVDKIEEIQRKARENTQGIRLLQDEAGSSLGES